MKWAEIGCRFLFLRPMETPNGLHTKNGIRTLLLLLSFTVAPARAQVRFMLMDMEVYEPVADVVIYTDRKDTFRSDSRGRVVIDKPFGSLTFTHRNYIHRTLRRSELTDTVRLLPKSVTINEVVITAKRPAISQQIFSSVENEARNYGQSPSGMDFLMVFKRNKVSRRVREKARKAVEDY